VTAVQELMASPGERMADLLLATGVAHDLGISRSKIIKRLSTFEEETLQKEYSTTKLLDTNMALTAMKMVPDAESVLQRFGYFYYGELTMHHDQIRRKEASREMAEREQRIQLGMDIDGRYYEWSQMLPWVFDSQEVQPWVYFILGPAVVLFAVLYCVFLVFLSRRVISMMQQQKATLASNPPKKREISLGALNDTGSFCCGTVSTAASGFTSCFMKPKSESASIEYDAASTTDETEDPRPIIGTEMVKKTKTRRRATAETVSKTNTASDDDWFSQVSKLMSGLSRSDR
jgi:hypothetical protein